VGIINASLAKERFGNQNPIGKRFNVGGHNTDGTEASRCRIGFRLLGVCGDMRYSSLRDEPPPQFFLLFSQQTEVWRKLELHGPNARRAGRDRAQPAPGLRARTPTCHDQRADAAAAD
jgi:hypothetical protein